MNNRRTCVSALPVAAGLLLCLTGCDPPDPDGEDEADEAAMVDPDFELQGEAADGEEIYERQCASCHGSDGSGDGPAGQALNPEPSDFTAAELSPAETFAVIRDGGPAVGKSAIMPGFEASLDEQQLHDVTAYTLEFYN